MKEIDRIKAYELLMQSSKLNPGKWVNHSVYVANVCERLAKELNLDKDKAYVYGLLHDIGRRVGVTGIRHAIDGYKYLHELGYEDVARYSLTHSYFLKDVSYINSKTDMSLDEMNFVQEYLNNLEYNLYDKVVQIGDCMCSGEEITFIERRLIDFHLRNGVSNITIDKWKGIFELQSEIEEILGYSMYKLFPEVIEKAQNNLIKDVITF